MEGREVHGADDTRSEQAPAMGALFWYLLLVIVAVSLYWRVTVLEPLPTTYHLQRYYVGMVRVRVMWLYLHPGEQTAKETQWLDANLRPFGEPPILETLTAIACIPFGSIEPRVACVITCLAWFLGGWFVFQTAMLIVGNRFAALAALAFYLLCPLAIVMSQTFQPEGLMTLALVIAIWALVRFPPDRNWKRTFILALVCGIAGFFKPGITFSPILGAYLGMRLSRDSLNRVVADGRSLLFAIVTLIPSVVWVLIFLQDRVGGKIMPAMLLDPTFYVRWFQRIDETLGWWVVVVLVVGAFTMVRHFHLVLGWGLIGGYLVYGMAFPWHTATHSYYQVPLIPIVALCLASTVAFVWERFNLPYIKQRTAALAVFLSLGVIFWYPSQTWRIVRLDRRVDIVEILGLDRLGQHIAPNTSVLCVDELSGNALLYHCWLHAYSWPKYGEYNKELRHRGTALSTEERFKEMKAQRDPRYFVITSSIHLQLLTALLVAKSDSQRTAILDSLSPRMKYESRISMFLEARFPRLVRDEKFLIYDLRGDVNNE